MLINPDPQQVMQIYLAGKILVEGDATKLIGAMQPSDSAPPAEAVEFYNKIEELTEF